MNNTLKRILEILSLKKILLISLIATIILTIFLNRIEKQVIVNETMNFFYLQLSFSTIIFDEIIRSWGDKGLSLYLATLWVDFLYSIAYAFLLSSGILFFKGRKAGFSLDGLKRIELFFILLPFIGALCDQTENILHIMILSKKVQGLVMMSSTISAVKWAILVISLAYFLMTYFSFRKEMRELARARR